MEKIKQPAQQTQCTRTLARTASALPDLGKEELGDHRNGTYAQHRLSHHPSQSRQKLASIQEDDELEKMS